MFVSKPPTNHHFRDKALLVTELQNALGGAASAYTAPLSVLQPTQDAILSDLVLVEQICQRQEPALGELYDRYSRLVYAIALRITGDQSTAEEVIQDVFSNIWQSAGGFRPGGNVKAWLVGITRHRAIDSTRARHFRLQSTSVSIDELQHLHTEVDTDTQVMGLLEQEQIQQALLALPQFQRSTIELAYYEGFTGSEIATHMGISLGTVKTRLRLGIEKLRSLLSSEPTTT